MSTWKLINEEPFEGLHMVRSPGAHVSDFTQQAAIKRGDLPISAKQKIFSDGSKNRMALGQAFEIGLVEMLCSVYPNRYFKGFEIHKNDIYGNSVYGTHDLIDIIRPCVDDIKVTWMSSRRHVGKDTKMIKYEQQVAAYVYMMSDGVLCDHLEYLIKIGNNYTADRLMCSITMLDNFGNRLWQTARLQIVYVNGDYKNNNEPLRRIYERVYTQAELIDNWITLTSQDITT